MEKTIIISERDNIAAVVENGKVNEFFIHRGDVLMGDVYLGKVENILPSIEAAFVDVGYEKMGFLHAADVVGKGELKDKLQPKQNILVQVVKEPTGHKGPRLTMSISLPGRFLVLMPDEKGINVSRKIVSQKERNRLKSIVNLLKPAGVGVIVRTEAENQSEAEIQEDLEFLLEKWNNIVTAVDTYDAPSLVYRDQDLLYRVIREACTEKVNEIVVDTPFAYHRAQQLLQTWNMQNGINLSSYKGNEPLLVAKGIDKEIKAALQTKVNLPSGGYLYIQTTEALTVIDVNSGRFTSSASQGETIRKTNLEAAHEIARQLRLRNIGGMIIIDFIDMENRVDKLSVLEELENVLEPDKSKPQVGQLSDLGLVELTRHRQGQSLAEIFTKTCPHCNGAGSLLEEFNFASSNLEAEQRAKASKMKLPLKPQKQKSENQGNQNKPYNQQQNRQQRDIKTSPSANASVFNKNRQQQQPQGDIKQLDENTLKTQFTQQNQVYVPDTSTVVKPAPLPVKTAKEDLSITPDVFTVLEEIETVQSQPQVQPQQPQQHQQAQQHRRPEYRHHQQHQPHQAQQPKPIQEQIEPKAVEVAQVAEVTEAPQTEENAPAKPKRVIRRTKKADGTTTSKPRAKKKPTSTEE